MQAFKKPQMMLTAKWLIYLLLLFIAFSLQSAPGFLAFSGVRPLLLTGLAISVAFFESELPACLYALAAGILFDYSSQRAIGANGIVFLLLALGLCLVTHYLSLPHFWNYCLWSAIALVLGFHIFFLFDYALDWADGTGYFYLTRLLPQLGYTYLLTLPWYPLIRAIHRLTPTNPEA